MCAIFGVINLDSKKLNLAHESLNLLKHRGPDDSGYLLSKENNVYFGHRRLSIIDLSSEASQPMINRDNSIWLTYNGEIYNYKNIKNELEKEGYKFKNKSDTEVVLASYETWGIEKTLSKLNGIFAFAISDFKKNKVYLIRDQVGVKPLYYCCKKNNLGKQTLSFASEIKALKKFETELQIDNTALYDFLTYRYIPSPKTMYKSVKQLQPGSYLSFSLNTNDEPIIKQYWSLKLSEIKENYNESLNNMRQKIEEAIHSQYLASDVPVSFFLSGGIDSACVLSSASKLGNQSLNAFTVKFSSSHRDESAEASKLADFLKVNHNIIEASEVSGSNFKIDQLVQWFDQPFSDTSSWPMNLLCKSVSKKTKVAISGDGADELFSGYKWYKKNEKLKLPYSQNFCKYIRYLSSLTGVKKFHNVANRLEPYIKKNKFEEYIFSLGSSLPKSWRYFWLKSLDLPSDYDEYWSLRAHWNEDLPKPLRYQLVDFNTFLPDDILTKVDRVSMASGLEVRVPFLDLSVIELAFNMSLKFGNKTIEKKILKDIFKGFVPDKYFDKPKSGFSAPEKLWDKKLNNSLHPTLGILSNFVKI